MHREKPFLKEGKTGAMKSKREVAFNVPDGYGVTEDRLFGGKHKKEWVLYVCDHYWALDIDDHIEFYYNPEHGLGKIRKSELPILLFENLKRQCVIFDSHGNRYWHNRIISEIAKQPNRYNVNFARLEDELRIGNWFYAQGYNYVTTNGLFYEICFPYDSSGREWNLWDMKLYDMVRMTCSTKTHYFLPTIWDLECFQGINHSSMVVRPFREERWDSKLWKNRFNQYSHSNMSEMDRSVIRFMRQEVFLHTAFVARNGWYISEQGNRIHLPDPSEMEQGTRLYSERLIVSKHVSENTRFMVENIDCLVAAQDWKEKGYQVAVLNMASRQNPGGGVYTGAGAQEENLFRRTNLFLSMYQFVPYAKDYGVTMVRHGYPLDQNFGGVFSPNVTVFRGLEKEGYPLLETPFEIDIISVPGMNKPTLNQEGMIEDRLVEGVKNKIRTIFEIALQNHEDCLILGAIGCGAFRNPPQHIAKLFHELLQSEYKDMFRVVVFAILEDHNSGKEHNHDGNYQPFVREFQNDIE